MSTDKRYSVSEAYSAGWLVNDRHFPGIPVAFCQDENKAWLIMMLLNDSWERAKKRSE